MVNTKENNNLIVKNTFFLYIRQILTLLISLYTVRVVLKVLGAEDYGIYNVVGGVVTLFSFLSGTMASATQRFLSYELGKQKSDTQKVFSVSLQIYIILIVIVAIFAETVGLWFVNNKLIIPEGRFFAANMVYQSSIISFIITLFCIPYNASIIAIERMDIFAYVSILDSVSKLLLVIILPYVSSIDPLIVYSILLTIIILLTQGIYVLYCKRYIQFCSYSKSVDINLLKRMFSFALWNMLGSLAIILRSQGINILINIFFNPTVNAARAIAYQINNAVCSFSNNFYTAIRPQLSKLCSKGDINEMINLGYNSTKYAYYLILLIVTPIYCEISDILSIWLGDVPNQTNLFVKITLMVSIVEIFAVPLVNMLQAYGRIRLYQMIVSSIYLLNLPISYFLLDEGYGPEMTFYVNLFLVIFSIIPRLLIVKSILKINIFDYFKSVIFRILPTSIVVFFWMFYGASCIDINNIVIRIVSHIILVLLSILILGLTVKERKFVLNKFLKLYVF